MFSVIGRNFTSLTFSDGPLISITVTGINSLILPLLGISIILRRSLRRADISFEKAEIIDFFNWARSFGWTEGLLKGFSWDAFDLIKICVSWLLLLAQLSKEYEGIYLPFWTQSGTSTDWRSVPSFISSLRIDNFTFSPLKISFSAPSKSSSDADSENERFSW